jgi:hypothetical protein
MPRTRTVVAAGVLATALAIPLAPAATATILPFGKGTAVGLSGGTTLVAFSLERPDRARSLGAVQGLQGDTRLVGIDYRPANDRLYGVGDQGGVYVVDVPSQRLLWKKAPTATLANRLSVPLQGTAFGVDFNPAADRLRIISDTGQSLRHNVEPGGTTLVDGTLAYAPATTPATGVTAAAYTNSDTDAATATTLFDVDVTLDQVVVQSPANAGSLAPTGKLGVDATRGGMDIDARNTGWAAFEVSGRTGVYRVDLLAGSAQRTGSFPTTLPVLDLAVPTGR